MATFMTAMVVRSVWHWTLYLLAVVSFAVAMVSAISIFGRNATYMEKIKVAHEKDEAAPHGDCVLRWLDHGLRWSFILGVVLAVLAAAIAAWPGAGDSKMSDESVTRVGTTPFKKSLDGASAMQPARQPLGQSAPQSQPAEGATPAGGTGSTAGGSTGGGANQTP